jgi:hypothetical protein
LPAVRFARSKNYIVDMYKSIHKNNELLLVAVYFQKLNIFAAQKT